MLRVIIPAVEGWDEIKEEYFYIKSHELQLEHSLVSVSKWESKWCKPFMSNDKMTDEETIDYIKCMTITQNVPPEVYDNIPNYIIEEIINYIGSPMTATRFYDDRNQKRNREVVTSELIYYWMIALNIPFECQKWHLNRLLTLIRVCNIKNTPPKKMSKRSIMSRNAALNAARRKQLNTRG